MNLIDEMRKATGYSSIQKVDPNTQQPGNELASTNDMLPQAAIPVALLGLYHYTRREENTKNLIAKHETDNEGWNEKLFGNHTKDVAGHIASYAHTGIEKAELELNKAAGTAIKIVKEALGKSATPAAFANVFKDNRSIILQHLPGALHIGSIVNDTTIDDRTNKMEGPMSGLMHTFEKIFSDSDANDSSKQ